MGFLDNLFGKKKEAEKTEVSKQDIAKANEQEKEWVALVRSTSEDLKRSLQAITLNDFSGKLGEGKLDDYKQNVGYLITALDQGIYSMDVSKINIELAKLPKKLETAVKNGDIDTADRVLRTFKYAIRESREERPEFINAPEKEKTFLERLSDRVDKYIEIIKMSEDIEKYRVKIEKNEIKYAELNKTYEKAEKDFKELSEKRDTANAELDKVEEFGSGNISAEALNLSTEEAKLNTLYNEKEKIKKQVEFFRDTMDNLTKSCWNVEFAIDKPLEDEQDYSEVVENAQDEYRSYMAQMEAQNAKLEALEHGIADIQDELLSSERMINKIIATREERRRILAKEKQREADEELGRKRRLERERQQQQQAGNTNSNILNN